MNQKKIAIAIITVLVIGAIGYFVLVKNQTPAPQTQQFVFASQEECEQKTGKPCSFQMCDYVPPDKTFEEVCGEDFKKSWVPTSSSSGNQTQPVGQQKSVSFEKVNLHSDWGLRESFDYSTYKGVFNDETELKRVWGYMWNAIEETKAWRRNTTPENQPILPIIDFGKHSVIWYANRGSNASFVVMDKIVEFDNLIEAHITLHYSDFITSDLNLWTIPKTSKPVQFVERQEYDGGI